LWLVVGQVDLKIFFPRKCARMDALTASDDRGVISILESMSDAFCAVDKQWRLIYVNGQAERITHCDKADLLGKLIWDAFPETIASAFYDHYHLKDAEGITLQVEAFCPQLEAWLEINAMPSPLGLAFYFRDVTKQQRSTAELQELVEENFSQHAYLETLLRHVPAGVMISEAPSGRLLFGNERMEQIIGHSIVSPNSVAEYAVWRGFHPDGRPYEPHEWPLARAVTTGEVVSCEEIHIERLDGGRLVLLVSAAPIRDRHGNILAGIVIDQDITERNKSAEALKISAQDEQLARRDAEQANKAKDQFIAMVSHELRTPLTPVVMGLAAMDMDPDLPQDFREDLAMIRRNVAIETKLIDDLLDLTSMVNGKFRLDVKQTGIHELLREVTKIVGVDIQGKGQTLTVDLAADDDTVAGDAVRLQQVFWNILKNAVKFTPCGGEICLRTFNLKPGTVTIEVQDAGVGIAQEALDNIFAPFEQAHMGIRSQFGGLGVGLTIGKAIVDLHGGSIRAESRGIGKGARFRVELPGTRRLEDSPTKAPRAAAKIGNSIRVLIVDDHEDTLHVLRRLLEKIGYSLATAGSATAALHYAAENDFDVLVSDLGLPDISGHELVRQIKKIRNVPAVAVSGFGTRADILKSREAGFYAHLTKPVDFELLHTTIQQAARVGVREGSMNCQK
jgi:PAS domain S-box-containing protein